MPTSPFNVIDLRGSPCGLGDILIALRDAVNTPSVLYVLPTRVRRFAWLFEGKAAAIFTDVWPLTPTPVPHVTLTPPASDLEDARQRLCLFKRPIALKINCSKAWSYLRQAPVDQWQSLVVRLTEAGFTPIQYGTSDEITLLKGTIPFLDLPLPRLAAHYQTIGTYLGVDTGDLHLAVSVGARCLVAVPPENSDYRYSDWHYQLPTVHYVQFGEMSKLYDLATS